MFLKAEGEVRGETVRGEPPRLFQRLFYVSPTPIPEFPDIAKAISRHCESHDKIEYPIHEDILSVGQETSARAPI
jgi:hypothetical protein